MLPKGLSHSSLTICHLTVEIFRFLSSFLQSQFALDAENLFVCKQPSLYQELEG
jgi:hypothetical protein